MDVQGSFDSTEHPTIQLEVIAEGGRNSDPAAAGVVARNLAASLRQDGYSVTPAYTGEKGGMLFDLLLPPAFLAIQLLWSHKEAIINLFKAVGPLFEQVMKLQDHHLKLEVIIDGASISVEAPDLRSTEQLTELGQKRAEQLALLLANKFESQHPEIAERVTPQSTMNVVVNVPPPPTRYGV